MSNYLKWAAKRHTFLPCYKKKEMYFSTMHIYLIFYKHIINIKLN